LEHAKQNHLFEAPGETAQHRRDGETDDGNQEEFAAPTRSASHPVTGVMIAAATI
jgi:hypothetical protein